MWRILCCAWVMALSLLQSSAAFDDFCARPANMDLCWWHNNYKRYFRFSRGDPFLRFGRSNPESWRFNPFAHMVGKRDTETDNYPEDGGYLRFGRSLSLSSPVPLISLLAVSGGSTAIRKKRDVTSASSAAAEVQRTTRDVQDGGFLRFGRDPALNEAAQDSSPSEAAELPAKRSNVDLPNGDREYLRFGRSDADDDDDLEEEENVPGFSKRRYLRFGRAGREGYLRFGKRREGYLRFGKREGREGYLRFGKRQGGREGYLRFGKRQGGREGYLRFGKRQGGREGYLRFGKRQGGREGYLRFGKRSEEMA